MNFAALYGLLAGALLIGILVSQLPLGRRRLLLALGAAGLALTPLLGGESPAMWVHGAVGAPSLTLVLLACRRLAAAPQPALLTPPTAAFIVLAALIFYPPALGWGPFDPYALGYQPLPLLLAMLPLGGWLARRRHDAWLVILGLDLLAYAAGIFGNLWDALFDPVLVLLAALRLVGGIARR